MKEEGIEGMEGIIVTQYSTVAVVCPGCGEGKMMSGYEYRCRCSFVIRRRIPGMGDSYDGNH